MCCGYGVSARRRQSPPTTAAERAKVQPTIGEGGEKLSMAIAGCVCNVRLGIRVTTAS